MTDTEREADEIIENAKQQYKLGNITWEDLSAIWIRVKLDVAFEDEVTA